MLPSSSRVRSSSGSSNSSTLTTLVQHMLGAGVSAEEVQEQVSKAQQTLQGSASAAEYASRRFAAKEEEERNVVERATKHLMRQGREKDAIKFQELHRRLQASPLVKNRAAILQFLLHLGSNDEDRAAPVFRSGSIRQDGGTTTPRSSKTRIQLNGTTKPAASSSTFLSSVDRAETEKSNAVHVRVDNGIFVPESKNKLSNASGNSGSSKALNGAQKSQKDDSRHAVGSANVTEIETHREPISRELLREIVFVFQGIEGKILRKDATSNPFVKIMNRERLSISEQQLILRLCELGFLYSSISAFCDSNVKGTAESGLVKSSFVQSLRNELSEFYLLLSALETATVPKKESETGKQVISTLHHLIVWTHKPKHRLQLLLGLVEDCKNERGGKLISKVHAFLHHGDERCVSIIRTMLCTVCKPMYTMLLRWLCDGRIEDAHNEFFVASDDKVGSQLLWHERYAIRHEMIPSFLDLKTVNKIFAIGKNINFLQEVCRDSTPIYGRDTVRASLEKTSVEHFFSKDQSTNPLHQSINRAFKDTSSHVLGVLFSRYKLLDHLTALRKYLLLGQGDIIRYLLELLEEDLSQPATTLQPHNLAGILETAIRATNAQFEDQDILGRLDVRLLETQPGDSGWDVFSLDYKVDGPIGTVFKSSTMTEYLMLFNAFWRAKHVEYLISDVWKRQASLFKMSKLLPELRSLLHIANLLTSEMVHFIHQLAYYIMFEVMECSWDLLLKKLKTAESLDELIEAHEEFLFTLHKRSLLNEESKEMLTQLRAIYDRIIEFKGIQHQLFSVASSEAEARVADRARLRRRDGRDRTDEVERSRRRERDFVRDKLPTLKSQLKIVSQSYQDMVRTFLLQLASSEDEALQFLSFRLDFNQHYKRRDARLGTPFTFKHRSRLQHSNRLVQSSNARI